MKKLFLLNFILPALIYCSQNNPDSVLVFYPKWKLNDTRLVKCIYIMESFMEYKNDTVKFKIETDSEIKVKEASDSAYIISWRNINYRMDSIPLNDPFMIPIDKLMDYFQDQVFELKFSKTGDYLDLLNWKVLGIVTIHSSIH